MAVFVNIEKNFRGFSLRVKMESNSPTMGILGASGSGKSMTLKCIAGIETPDKGKIGIHGKTVFDSDFAPFSMFMSIRLKKAGKSRL